MTDEINSRLGRWLYSQIAPAAPSSPAARDELIAAWTSQSTAPLIVLWYVLVLLAYEVLDPGDDAAIRELSAVIGSRLKREDIDASLVEAAIRMALDDRSIDFPDLPTETVASLYAVISMVLARSVPDETLRGMIARAEAAAVRQGIGLP